MYEERYQFLKKTVLYIFRQRLKNLKQYENQSKRNNLRIHAYIFISYWYKKIVNFINISHFFGNSKLFLPIAGFFRYFFKFNILKMCISAFSKMDRFENLEIASHFDG